MLRMHCLISTFPRLLFRSLEPSLGYKDYLDLVTASVGNPLQPTVTENMRFAIAAWTHPDSRLSRRRHMQQFLTQPEKNVLAAISDFTIIAPNIGIHAVTQNNIYRRANFRKLPKSLKEQVREAILRRKLGAHVTMEPFFIEFPNFESWTYFDQTCESGRSTLVDTFPGIKDTNVCFEIKYIGGPPLLGGELGRVDMV